jgi:hypothetical protein
VPGDPDVPDDSTTQPDEPIEVDCHGDPTNPLCVVD